MLVIRGELLKRYPTAVIYAHRAAGSAASGSRRRPDDRRIDSRGAPARRRSRRPRRRTRRASKVLTPLYEAKVDPDIYFFGFDLTVGAGARAATARTRTTIRAGSSSSRSGPGEPRFGLDTDKQPPYSRRGTTCRGRDFPRRAGSGRPARHPGCARHVPARRHRRGLTTDKKVQQRRRREGALEPRHELGTPGVHPVPAAGTGRRARLRDAPGGLSRWCHAATDGDGDGRDGDEAAPADPRFAIGELRDATPILMFPVRIETRFAAAGDELMLRVYPDECLLDTFDPTLTTTEVTNAEAYWVAIWKAAGGEGAQRAAWASLVRVHGAGRARWIVRDLPTHATPARVDRAGHGGRPDLRPRADEGSGLVESRARSAAPPSVVFIGYTAGAEPLVRVGPGSRRPAGRPRPHGARPAMHCDTTATATSRCLTRCAGSPIRRGRRRRDGNADRARSAVPGRL